MTSKFNFLKIAFLFPIILIGCILAAQGPAAAGTVTIGWDKNAEPNIGGYIVYWDTKGRANCEHVTCADGAGVYKYANKKDVGDVNQHSISGLMANTKYHFAVTAYDTTEPDPNESYFSEELVWTSPKDWPPGKVINLYIKNYSKVIITIE